MRLLSFAKVCNITSDFSGLIAVYLKKKKKVYRDLSKIHMNQLCAMAAMKTSIESISRPKKDNFLFDALVC